MAEDRRALAVPVFGGREPKASRRLLRLAVEFCAAAPDGVFEEPRASPALGAPRDGVGGLMVGVPVVDARL